MSARTQATDGETPSFEEALARLETIVEELESGSLTLEQSITRYEEGIRLSRRLTETLDQVEKRIERLVEASPSSSSSSSSPPSSLPPSSLRGPAGGEGELPF